MTCYSFNCSAHSRLFLCFCGNHSSFFVNDINRSLGVFLSLLAARERVAIKPPMYLFVPHSTCPLGLFTLIGLKFSGRNPVKTCYLFL